MNQRFMLAVVTLISAFVAFTVVKEIANRASVLGDGHEHASVVSIPSPPEDTAYATRPATAAPAAESIPTAAPTAAESLSTEMLAEVARCRGYLENLGVNRFKEEDVAECRKVLRGAGVGSRERVPPPRTWSRPYNELYPHRSGKRYLLYQATGGFTNQVLTLARAAALAKRLGRVLVVPMIARHTTLLHVELLSPEYDMIAADRVLELDYFFDNSGLDGLVVLNSTLQAFTDHVQSSHPEMKWDVHYRKTPDERKARPIRERHIKAMEGSEADVIALTGVIMYQRFDLKCDAGRSFSYYGCLDSQRWLRFGPWWRDIGLRAAAAFGSFNGVHMRLGDYMRRYDDDPIKAGDVFLGGIMRARFPNSTLVYVATQVSQESKAALEHLERRGGFRTVTSQHISSAVLDQFDKGFEIPAQKTLRDDLLLPIEMIIMSLANNFVGVDWSNVSRMIQFLRDPDYFSLMVPERADKFLVRCAVPPKVKGTKLRNLVFGVRRARDCHSCAVFGLRTECDGDCRWSPTNTCGPKS